MSVAYFIVLERTIDGFDSMIDGKRLAQAAEALDALAPQLGVRALSDFISFDPAVAAEFLADDENDVGDFDFPPSEQFLAEEGLVSVRALLAHVAASPDSVPNAQGVVADLRNCERVLEAASSHDIGWHFEVDT